MPGSFERRKKIYFFVIHGSNGIANGTATLSLMSGQSNTDGTGLVAITTNTNASLDSLPTNMSQTSVCK